ncbi:hypothetical protein L249_0049 [Ophiocordyceps polyrhachis-furcata BCC 54312]|uniref:Cytochrome P450 n=1 Tax=Ophiocordyceps polyrhachis-furcata BCC 54312 TaxID=1330021 RepID=A0A367LDS0_9HYPO|nr:hypothetical protein L249_0049 [Ophiocordyceps polyrhachis-furcata BCC 54312]
MPFLLIIIIIIIIIAALIVYEFSSRKAAGPSLPPAPRRLPIIGNFMDMPPGDRPEYLHWLKHREAYGPISSVTFMGETLILLHDKQAAFDLLEKKSTMTAGRPALVFASMCRYSELLAFLPYGEKFRRARRFVDHQLGTRARVARFDNVQEVEVRRFLLRVLKQPGDVHRHLHTLAGAIILKMTYGYSIKPEQPDPLVELSERMATGLSLASVPLAWLVDAMPFLRHLPGMAFQKRARHCAKVTEAVVEIPYSFVRRQMVTGLYPASYTSDLVDQYSHPELSGDDEDTIKWTAAILYAAGSETTAYSLSSFVLAMVLFPHVQRKAQEELDRVIGGDRLPRLSDRDKLPYIEGVVGETFRWSPIGPLGFAHKTTESTVYNGYLIPKGATIIPSIFWFLHDPDVYPDPESFDPERYGKPRFEPDPKSVAFGFGRRICPGRYLADGTLFLTIAQTLAAFTISKAVDGRGRELEAKLETTAGVTNKVKDFPYKMVPRSAKAATLVRSIEVDQPWGEEAGCASLDDITIDE